MAISQFISKQPSLLSSTSASDSEFWINIYIFDDTGSPICLGGIPIDPASKVSYTGGSTAADVIEARKAVLSGFLDLEAGESSELLTIEFGAKITRVGSKVATASFSRGLSFTPVSQPAKVKPRK